MQRTSALQPRKPCMSEELAPTLDPLRPVPIPQPDTTLELPWYAWLLLGALVSSLGWAWYIRKLRKRQALVDKARDKWEQHLVDELNKPKS